MNLSSRFIKTINTNPKLSILGSKINNKWNKINREELYSLMHECIYTLKHYNVKKGDRVAYKGNNSIEWVAWNMSCYSVGAIWVPMYSEQNITHTNFIIDNCQPKLLITDNFPLLKKEHNNNNTNIISNEISKTKNDGIISIENNDIATLIYTSGTTGNPKGVVLTHENIISNLEGIHDRFKDIGRIESLNILPWAHIYSLTCELYYNLLYDNCTNICNNKESFMKDCREVSPDVLYIVPKILQLIKNKTEFLDKPIINNIIPIVLNTIFGGNLKNIFIGGAKLDLETRSFYSNNKITICEGYGSTETSPLVSVNHLNYPRNIESVGKILDNVAVKIINDEICVSGSNVMPGYWNNKIDTDKCMVSYDNKTWYKTGDSGYIDDGYLFYKGRISDNYKLSNGKFVNIHEVEDTVRNYIKSNFIVYSRNNQHNDIITDEYIDNNKLELINNKLDNYLKIKNVTVIDEDEFKKFMTPKMSIKRKLLINYVEDIIK
tara:strand:+ start:577 stop:2052 length:1476 start_codon:yes stop_codon:yes gene_type:complete